ncbi:MAG: 2-phospho-L-lactate guanylyltransferase [Thermoleophilia bacterium]
MTTPSGIHVLVPLKRLDEAKTRLAGLLTPEDRRALMGALLARTLGVVKQVQGLERVTLVSGDASAAEIAAAHGVACYDDGGLPWNEGLAAAIRDVVSEPLVGIVSADIPLVQPDELDRLAAAVPGRGIAIARAVDAGTNSVWMRPPGAMTTVFGAKGSAALHAERAREAGLEAVVLDLPGTALDLDTPEDVEKYLEVAPPGEVRSLLERVQTTTRRSVAVR